MKEKALGQTGIIYDLCYFSNTNNFYYRLLLIKNEMRKEFKSS